jgi:hypothetical protein
MAMNVAFFLSSLETTIHGAAGFVSSGSIHGAWGSDWPSPFLLPGESPQSLYGFDADVRDGDDEQHNDC